MALNIDGTTGISGVDGSASAPALQGTDSNTGINFGSDTVNINTGGVTRATVDSSGNLNIPNDSGKIQLGTSSDLQIYHDGTHSYLLNGTGNLFVEIPEGKKFQIQHDSEAIINGYADGRVELYYDNDKVFETVSGGTQVPASRKIYVGVFNNSNGFANFSDGSGSSTLYIGNQSINTSSDQRLKTNIVDTALDATTKLKQVRVVDFNWNDPSDKAINNKNSRGLWTGTIAQEIVDIFPHAVNAPRPDGNTIDTEDENIWGMEYQHLVPVLIKGFQEQQARIETLETEKTQMQTDLTALTARVTALEAA